ncbi:hypothetical protein HanHA300_Chr16g0611251 [Helianthus annuus]|nr:hypothetical protein HanHA300_Chr16g0611251 [Helianthus annuus]KAJ0460529.1 hypothetical protein HanHA89_Chr16g0661841 [Helianthus annuus]
MRTAYRSLCTSCAAARLCLSDGARGRSSRTELARRIGACAHHAPPRVCAYRMELARRVGACAHHAPPRVCAYRTELARRVGACAHQGLPCTVVFFAENFFFFLFFVKNGHCLKIHYNLKKASSPLRG